MASRLTEFFGFAPLDPAGQVEAAAGHCPFVNDNCIKPKHGGCSLEQSTSPEPIIICPNRLYADNHKVLEDIAVQAFGAGVYLTRAAEITQRRLAGTLTGNEVALFGRYWGNELAIPQPRLEDDEGSSSFYIDYVMARLNIAGEMTDFTAVEVQTIDTTGSYKAQSDALFQNQQYVDSQGRSPGWTNAGLNWANVSKRILPQLIYKGYVLRRERLCGKGLFFVCPTVVLNRVKSRLGTKMLEYPIAAGTITFQAYDLGPMVAPGQQRSLVKGQTFTTTVEQVAYAFVSPVNLPAMGVYEEAIRRALAR